NRAAVDGDDVVSARRRETDFQYILGAAPRMQRGTPAASPMRVDDIAYRRDDAGLGKRFHHQLALPQMIFGERPVLHGAAAAGAEMLADRQRTLVRGMLDVHEMPPIGVAGNRLDR